MDVWAEVLSKVERRVNRQCFDTWFRPIVFDGCDESAVHLTVPNENFKRLLLDNYSTVLRESISEAGRGKLQVKVAIEPHRGVGRIRWSQAIRQSTIRPAG